MGKVVAIVGASSHREKYGNRAVRAYAAAGYTVIPIHPRAASIEGRQAYASVLDVPGPIDLVSFYVPPDIGEQVIEDCLARHDFRRFGLTAGQLEGFQALPKGSKDQRRYLHGLASDPKVLHTQKF